MCAYVPTPSLLKSPIPPFIASSQITFLVEEEKYINLLMFFNLDNLDVMCEVNRHAGELLSINQQELSKQN